MVTNGFISDYEFVRKTIKELSELPLSIIMVGIGEGKGRNKDGLEIDYFDVLRSYFS